MKKIVLLMFVSLIGLAACSDDDDKNKVNLNKLTKVTCYKNNETTPYYQVEIFYNADGTIAYLDSKDKGEQRFIYVDNKLTVTEPPGGGSTEYLLNNNFIRQKNSYGYNRYTPNTLYCYEEMNYTYKRNKLSAANRLIRWPQEDGVNYETRSFDNYNQYTWTGNNITRFSQETREMIYEYTSDTRPDNLPFMIPASFAPVEFEVFNPLNYLTGALNAHLVSRAYWYNVPDASTICAEYFFDYTQLNEYVTMVQIEEKNHVVNEGGYNVYRVSLEYNYSNK